MAETKLTVLISKDLRRQANAAAAVRGNTLSNVVRAALVEYIEETTQLEHDAEAALKMIPCSRCASQVGLEMQPSRSRSSYRKLATPALACI